MTLRLGRFWLGRAGPRNESLVSHAQAALRLEIGERPSSAAVAAFGGDDPGGESGGGDGAEEGADGKIEGGDVAPGELDQAVARTVNKEKYDKGDGADDTPRHFVDDVDE